jgi:hypothetical protein
MWSAISLNGEFPKESDESEEIKNMTKLTRCEATEEVTTLGLGTSAQNSTE